MIVGFYENFHSTNLLNQKSVISSPKCSMGSILHLYFIRVQVTLCFCSHLCFLSNKRTNHARNTEVTRAVERAWDSQSRRLRLKWPTMKAVGPQTCYLASLNYNFIKFKCNNLYSQSRLGELNDMKEEQNSWIPEKMSKMHSLLDFIN